MIAGQNDDRTVQNTCFFKPLQQVSHRLLQLVVGTQIPFGALRQIAVQQLTDGIDVSGDHDVVGRIVAMPREGHVVGTELFIIDVVVDRLFHHLQIGSRPGGRETHAFIHELAFKTHIGQSLIAAVIEAVIIMVSSALYVFGEIEHIA